MIIKCSRVKLNSQKKDISSLISSHGNFHFYRELIQNFELILRFFFLLKNLKHMEKAELHKKTPRHLQRKAKDA